MNELKEVTIHATLPMGDAGWPLDVNVSVWYIEDGDKIQVTDSEDDCALDNPPLNWEARINEVIDEHFLDKKVEFLTTQGAIISAILAKDARGKKMDYLVRNDAITAMKKLPHSKLVAELLKERTF